MIQGLLSKVLDFIDLFCDGAVSCAIGASVFKTCQGAEAKGMRSRRKNKINTKSNLPKVDLSLETANQMLRDLFR